MAKKCSESEAVRQGVILDDVVVHAAVMLFKMLLQQIIENNDLI